MVLLRRVLAVVVAVGLAASTPGVSAAAIHFSHHAVEGSDTALGAPTILPTRFVAAGADNLDCSWVHRPDGNVSLLYTTDGGMREVVLRLNVGTGPTWGVPSPAVPLPLLNGSVRLTAPRGQVVQLNRATSEINNSQGVGTGLSEFRFAGLVDAYPLGITRLNGEWDAVNKTFAWDVGGSHDPVWTGYDGGGIRNVVVVQRLTQPTTTAANVDQRNLDTARRAPSHTSMASTATPRLFAAFQANRVPGVTEDPSNVTALVSDDDGATWRAIPSHVTAPIPAGSKCYGAVEPSSVQLPNGTLWVLFRTQTGRLWQTHSNDHGDTLVAGMPSAFRSGS